MTILLAIGVIILLIFLYFRFKLSQQMPLLKISIGTTDNKKYLVSFQKMHSELKQIEYVRMILHFIPKMLYAIMPDDIDQKNAVIDFITSVCLTTLEPKEVKNIINNKIPRSLGMFVSSFILLPIAK